jgi:ribonuclease Z
VFGVAWSANGQTHDELRIVLLGVRGGPNIDPQKFGISTLILAGNERLLFDAGRGAPEALVRASISPKDATKVFLTHLHSDHIISLPELFLYPWASQGRTTPLQVWGPSGTKAMMDNLVKAFAFDIRVRRDVDEKFSAAGIKVVASDIRQGTIYESSGVKVTAFTVNHDPVTPAFGYRVDYGGHSVVLSGDTKPTDNLVEHAKGVDLLIHEIGRWKQDAVLSGPASEVLPSGLTREKMRIITDHHTDASELGVVLSKIKPKLAVASHYPAVLPNALAMIREHYDGPFEFGDDGMIIQVADTVSIVQNAFR